MKYEAAKRVVVEQNEKLHQQQLIISFRCSLPSWNGR